MVNDNTVSKVIIDNVTYDMRDNSKSIVSVSDTGTATDTVSYITIDGVEKKLNGGGSGPSIYLKSASSTNNTLTIIDQSDNSIVYTPNYSAASFGNGYAICNTPTSSSTKNVNISDYVLSTGGYVSIKFSNAVDASATLNISDTGAKSIYYNGSAISSNIIKSGDITLFVYNGAQYDLIAINTDITTYINSAISLDTTNDDITISNELVEKIKSAPTHYRLVYNGAYYYYSSYANSASTGELLLFTTSSFSLTDGNTAILVLVIYKGPEETSYTVSAGTSNLASYNSTGLLTIGLDNAGKFLLKDSSGNLVAIYKNSSQSGNATISLPASSGTLATLDDATVTSAKVTTALGYTPYDSANPAGYITGISSADVTTALGYTPYNGATNPNNFISGITSSDVTGALGYTPYNATNPEGYISEVTSKDVTDALGYTPYNASNPNNYITGISSSDVTTALGYTPYDSANPSNYVTANTTGLNNYYTKTTVDGMVANRFQAKIVTSLPTSGISTSTIYMIADSTLEDSYDEYMYIENAWVKIGSTSIDMTEYAKTDDLHNVAFTGAYSSLVGRPTIPASTSDLTNDSGFITETANNLTYYTKTADLADVAISGSYNDLYNKPTVPTAVSQLTNDSGFVTTAGLASTSISTFVNNVPYATLNDIQGLEDIDVEEIKKAIAAMEHIGTVTQVTAGTGLSGGGNTTVTINHSNSVTANTNYPSGTSTPENGGTFNVRDVKYDAQGHVTDYQDRAITLPLIPIYDDTAVRGLISTETTARQATDTRVTALENMWTNEFTSFVFCIFGIEQYIDPSTMQPVTDRYYQRSDVDTGIFMDSEKIDIHLKAWLKYHYNIDTQDKLKNVTCYVYALGDHGVYVNHMVTYWSQRTNTQISSYPHLLQTGMFVDDGYGSVHRFSTTEVGALLSSSDDGYIQADPAGSGKGFVTGWNTLLGRVDDLEDAIGEISTKLDEINGETV